MKKIFALLIVLTLISITSADDTKKYGAEITLSKKTTISEILTNAESFVGKKVLVNGTVIDVCAKRGCWINLGSDVESESIRVKVKDDEIVFPKDAKGKKALVEGEVYSIVVDGEGCGGDCNKEEGEKNHESEHEKTTKKVYQIKGLGAVIK